MNKSRRDFMKELPALAMARTITSTPSHGAPRRDCAGGTIDQLGLPRLISFDVPRTQFYGIIFDRERGYTHDAS